MAPLKTVRVKQRSEPWVTGEILEFIRNRTKIFRKFKRTKESSLYNKYVELRNKVQALKNKAKAEYYIQKVKDNKNKPRNLCQILKSLGTSSKMKNNSSNIGLLINDNICFDKIKVSIIFNNYFTNIASNLVDRLPASTGNYCVGHFSDYYNYLFIYLFIYLLNLFTQGSPIQCLMHCFSMRPCKIIYTHKHKLHITLLNTKYKA